MDKKDFKNLLSEAFEKNNKKIDGKFKLLDRRFTEKFENQDRRFTEKFENQDKKFRSLLKVSFERYDKKSKKFLEEAFERNNKKIISEFGRFVDVSIVPQFDRIYTELREIRDWVNDLSHSQDRMLGVLEKHGDRLERIEAKH